MGLLSAAISKHGNGAKAFAHWMFTSLSNHFKFLKPLCLFFITPMINSGSLHLVRGWTVVARTAPCVGMCVCVCVVSLSWDSHYHCCPRCHQAHETHVMNNGALFLHLSPNLSYTPTPFPLHPALPLTIPLMLNLPSAASVSDGPFRFL